MRSDERVNKTYGDQPRCFQLMVDYTNNNFHETFKERIRFFRSHHFLSIKPKGCCVLMYKAFL